METIRFKARGKECVIDERALKKMKAANVGLKTVKSRMNKYWSFEEAIEVPVGMKREEWKGFKKLNSWETSRERVKACEEQKLRRKKPHLFNVPQVHPRGKWCVHLMKDDTFPKRVVK